MPWRNPPCGGAACMNRPGEPAPQQRPRQDIRGKMRPQHDSREPDQHRQREPYPSPPRIPQRQDHCRGKSGGRMPRRKRGVGILCREAGKIGEERSRLRSTRPCPTGRILQDLIQDPGSRHRCRAQQPLVSTIPIPSPPSPQRRHQENPDIYPPVSEAGDSLPQDVQSRRRPVGKHRLKAQVFQNDEGQTEKSRNQTQAQVPLRSQLGAQRTLASSAARRSRILMASSYTPMHFSPKLAKSIKRAGACQSEWSRELP